MKKILKEPLTHFVLLGGLIFLINFVFNSSPEDAPVDRVEVTDQTIAGLSAQFSKRWLRSPNKAELTELIEGHVKEEILYREALRMGLEQDDAVIRRRLRQKIEFISSDIMEIQEPSEEDLQSYLENNTQKFIDDPKLAFRHIYFSSSKRGSKVEEDAKAAKKIVVANNNAERTLGDPSLLPTNVVLSSITTIGLKFGETFAEDIYNLELNSWSDPIPSTYGYHLVIITEKQMPEIPSLEEIRPLVNREWSFDQQKKQQELLYQELKTRYLVNIHWPDSVQSTSGE